MLDLFTAFSRRQPLVVGSIGDPSTLHATIGPAECDLLELRLDVLGHGPGLRSFAEDHATRVPILITARHPDEGGQNNLSSSDRAAALGELLSVASMIDLEQRSLEELSPLWREAGQRGLARIASWHNFHACPAVDDLRRRIDAMHAAGADLAKFAFRLVEPEDLQVVLAILRLEAPLPLAVMGMGPLAPSSRLLAAQLGSVLNYGYLGASPTAPGQWPAPFLKEAIAQSLPSEEAPL